MNFILGSINQKGFSKRAIFGNCPFLFLTSVLLVNFMASAYATGSISGKVTLQGRTNHSSCITFELRNPPETTPIAPYQPSNDEDTNKPGTQITTTSDGSYTLTGIPAGIYNLSAKASFSLRKNYVLMQVTNGQTTSNIDFSLRGGDANDDNSVATGDMVIVSNAWLSHPGSPNWDPRADFNGDNSIGTGDMVILQSNWLKNGFEPQPAITSPQDNSILTSSPIITVSGTIDYNNTSVVVNGTTATVANNIFTATGISLIEGQNTIGATATNTMGNKNADFILLTLDTIAPVISITSPEDDYITTTETITVSGTVDDNQANVTVNGNTAIVSNGTFTANNITLTQGSNTITANATDLAGHSSSDSITVTLDQDPPAINIYTPHHDSTTRSNLVYGRVSDDTQTVTVNGTSAEILSDFSFIARPTLTAGANTITVQATDYAGNINQSSIAITYNTQTPKVTIISPLDNSEHNISPINVTGTNTTDISFIVVNFKTALIDTTNFAAEGVTLSPLKTVIIATGFDVDNNKFLDSIVVTSPSLSNYELIKVSGDVREDDPNRPSAGLTQILKAKLDKNTQPALNEEIQFSITQGQGTLSSQSSYTDQNGEAQITLTTDTNSDITNQVECYSSNNSLVKATFYVDTKPTSPSILTKITDDSITPVPSATIPLIVKLTDSNNNIIQGETINFQVIQGIGTISSPTAITDYYGEASINLTCPNSASTLTQVQASSNINPSVNVTINVTTSSALTVTADDLFNEVKYNAQNIQDQIVEETIVTDNAHLPPSSQYRVWQKGSLLKVQDMSTNEITIRPQLTQNSTSDADVQIISYNSSNNIYVVRSKAANQINERPYTLTYIDYSKGVITKIESYYDTGGFKTLHVTEMMDFVQIPQANNVWIYNTKVEKMYREDNVLVYTTTTTVTSQQFNVGLTDADFH